MRRLRGERGAMAVLIAVLMVVFFGAVTIVVDVGALYWERRELQNGADGAALAVARDCALGVYACPPGTAADPASAAFVLAGAYADTNANDREANLGHPDRPACSSSTDGVSQEGVCYGSGEVTVTTTTRDSDGNSSLSHFFAPVLSRLLGADPRDSTRVGAAATAAWGSPSSLATVPIVMSTCEYDLYTNSGTSFAQPDFYDDTERTLKLHDPSNAAAAQCPVGPAGMDANGDGKLPAGFGWLETDASCNVGTTTVGANQWVTKNSGNNPACNDAVLFARFTPGTTVAIPIFGDFCRPSQTPPPTCPDFNNRDKYRIVSYAAFYISGYRLGGGNNYHKTDNVYRTTVPCASNERCITGYFTTMTITDGDLGGPPGSIKIVKLTR